MPENTNIVPRHKILAFYGVKASGGDTTFHRMKFFSNLTENKNPQEYNRKYVDEATQRNDVTGYSPQLDYGFDKYTGDPVLTDIVKKTNHEVIGSDAICTIILVDTETKEARKRDYALIPGSEGDDANIYKYSGSFKANGEIVHGTAETDDNWQTCTFTPGKTD